MKLNTEEDRSIQSFEDKFDPRVEELPHTSQLPAKVKHS
jgi:hypothetical protein